MNTYDLANYKSIYLGIEVPSHIMQKRWDLLAAVLPQQKRKTAFNKYFKLGAVFLSLTIIITTATVGAAQSAKPGDALYSVKSLTKKISTAFSKPVNTNIKPSFPRNIFQPAVKATIKPTEETKKPKSNPNIQSNNNNTEQSQKQNLTPSQGSFKNESQVKGASTQNPQSGNSNSHAQDSHDNNSSANSSKQNSGESHQENSSNHGKNP